jgi:predicted glycogen debranching enzyme
VSHYRAVDPALWYARAIRLYEQAGGSKERVNDDLLPALREIVAAYRASDDEVIACDGAGLIRNGNPDFAFTWMDSLPAPGQARYGYCVEVNALWYEAIDFLGKLERRAGQHTAHRELTSFRRSVGEAFVSRFWLRDGGYLADTWDHGEPDRSVRPNMVIAAALEASPLDRSQRASVVDVARSELLTPRGLRTLSPREPGYRGRYAGAVEQRDAAYHQGTVWPWLLGFYVEATLRGRGRTPAVKRDLRRLLEGFDDHLRERCLGQVSEVFGGDPPHRPGGTVAQAWSVGELLRAYALLEGPRR